MALKHANYDGTDEEFAEATRFLSRSTCDHGRLQNWSVCRFEDWKFGGNARRARSDPTFYSRNLHIWRDDGKVVGMAISERGDMWTLLIDRRRRDLDEIVLDWIEENATPSEGRIMVTAWNNDHLRNGSLKTRGFSVIESGGFNRRYDTAISPHSSPLPDGYRLSTLADEGLIESYVKAVRGAFGRDVLDMDWFTSKSMAPSHSMEHVVVVLSPDGNVASFADIRVDEGSMTAEIDPIGTSPDHQRKGLAMACIAECFRTLFSEGIRDAFIGSAPEPAPSNILYESLTPVERYEEFVWGKDVLLI